MPEPSQNAHISATEPPFRRWWGVCVSLVMLGAAVYPALRDPPKDGFPLSTYPMFSHGRKSPRARIRHVVAIDAQGKEVMVPPKMVANDEVMQAVMTVARAVKQKRAPQLCGRVAAQIHERGELDGIVPVRVEVRTDVYDAVAYFEGDTRPRRSKVHATCEVAPQGVTGA